MEYIYQLIQIYNDNGDEFLLGTYSKKEYAEEVLKETEKTLPVQYQIRKEKIIK